MYLSIFLNSELSPLAPAQGLTLLLFHSCHGDDEPEDSAAHNPGSSSGYHQGLRAYFRNGQRVPASGAWDFVDVVSWNGERRGSVFNANK